VGY
jgi:hypothetical protein